MYLSLRNSVHFPSFGRFKKKKYRLKNKQLCPFLNIVDYIKLRLATVWILWNVFKRQNLNKYPRTAQGHIKVFNASRKIPQPAAISFFTIVNNSEIDATLKSKITTMLNSGKNSNRKVLKQMVKIKHSKTWNELSYSLIGTAICLCRKSSGTYNCFKQIARLTNARCFWIRTGLKMLRVRMFFIL